MKVKFTRRFLLGMVALMLHFVHPFVLYKPAIRTRHGRNISHFAVSMQQICVIDGSQFNALDLFVSAEGNAPTKVDNVLDGEEIGIIQVAVVSQGTKVSNHSNRDYNRIVGFVVDPNTVHPTSILCVKDHNGKDIHLSKDSIAKVPSGISDEEAIATSIAALSGVHCAFFNPIREDDYVLKNVGGGEEDFVLEQGLDDNFVSESEKKVVVLGGGDYACFVSEALAVLGGHVIQITTKNLRRPRNKISNLSVSPPGIGDEEFSFSSIMTFDSLVDTLSDETKLGEAACRGLYDGDAILGEDEACSSAVIKLLQKQNRCKRYISTLTSSQRKIRDDGLIWGSGKANSYGKNVVKSIHFSSPNIVSPRQFGQKTLQPLLEAGVTYKGVAKKGEIFMFGWNMQDFLELVSWPRDADGGNTRFGLPVVADLDSLVDKSDEQRMISAPPKLASGAQVSHISHDDYKEEINPFVLDIFNLKDLNDKVLSPKKDCILFLSAAYCRTCRYLAPQYSKLARAHAEANNGVIFAKSNASSKIGKEVLKALGVNAVPAFCLFRAGKRYGNVISVSKIPSKKLDVALDLLISGGSWDGTIIDSTK